MDNWLKFFIEIGKMKRIIRRGWIRKNIMDPESIGEHTLRVAYLSMFLSKELNLDCYKMMCLSLIHELGEIKVGDIIPSDGILPEKKSELEKEAVKELLTEIDDDGYWLSCFYEFENGSSPEALVVKELDRLEMAFQALEYEKNQKIKLDEFFDSANKSLSTPFLKELFNKIILERDCNGS